MALLDSPPRPQSAWDNDETALDRFMMHVRNWGSPSSPTSPRQTSLSLRTKKSIGSMRASLRRSGARPSGLSHGLEEGGIGQSPSFRSPRTDKLSFATSRRSSAGTSWSSRSNDAFTPATSVSHSMASPKMVQKSRTTPSRPTADARQPIILDLYQPTAESWREKSIQEQAGGSFVAALGLQTLPTPKVPPRPPVLIEPPVMAAEPRTPVTAPSVLGPRALSSRDGTIIGPSRSLLHPPELRGRSRSMSDVHAATREPGAATSDTPERVVEDSRGRGRGPVVFRPADASCETWIAPQPRLVGGHKTSPEAALLSIRGQNTAMSSVDRRVAAKRAQHRASRIVENGLYAERHDPRMASRPIGAPWTAESGIAEPDSPPVGTSFDFMVKGWRAPRRPTMRTIATQTPDGDVVFTRPRSASFSALPVRRERPATRPSPRKRASSLEHYHASLQKDLPSRPRSPSPALLAKALQPAQTAYPPGTEQVARKPRATTPLSLAPAPRRGDSRAGSRPDTGESDSQPSLRVKRIAVPAVLAPGVATPTLGGETDKEYFAESAAPLPSASTAAETRSSSRSGHSKGSSDPAELQQSKAAGSSGRLVFRGSSAEEDGTSTARPSFDLSSLAAVSMTAEPPIGSARSSSKGATAPLANASVATRPSEVSLEHRLQELFASRPELGERTSSDEVSALSRRRAPMLIATNSPLNRLERPTSGFSASSWLDFDDENSPAGLPRLSQKGSTPVSGKVTPNAKEEDEDVDNHIEFDLDDDSLILVPPQTPATTVTTPNSSVHPGSDDIPPLPNSVASSSLSPHSPSDARVSHDSSLGSPRDPSSGSFRSRLSLENFPQPPPSAQNRTSFLPIGEEAEVSSNVDARSTDAQALNWLDMDSPDRSSRRSAASAVLDNGRN